MRRLIRYDERRALERVINGFLSRMGGRHAADHDPAPRPGRRDIDGRRVRRWTDVDAAPQRSGNHHPAVAVSPPMTTQPRVLRRFLLVTATLAVALAACSSGAAPAASTPASTTPGPATAPTSEPAGGGSDGNVGSGGGVVVDPGQPTPVDPAAGQPAIVIPKAGQKNPHAVSAAKLEASVDGRHVLVKVTWWSGVEPCNVLDSVKVDRSGTDIAISLVEGASNLDAMCIEIAQLKATIVDLGDLEPGTYRIRAPNSEAPPIQVTVS